MRMNSSFKGESIIKITHAYQLRLTAMTIILPKRQLDAEERKSLSPGKRKLSPPPHIALAKGAVPSLMSPAKKAKIDAVTNISSPSSSKQQGKAPKHDSTADFNMFRLETDEDEHNKDSSDNSGSPTPRLGSGSPSPTLGRSTPAAGPSSASNTADKSTRRSRRVGK
jgi:hypothetical protein